MGYKSEMFLNRLATLKPWMFFSVVIIVFWKEITEAVVKKIIIMMSAITIIIEICICKGK